MDFAFYERSWNRIKKFVDSAVDAEKFDLDQEDEEREFRKMTMTMAKQSELIHIRRVHEWRNEILKSIPDLGKSGALNIKRTIFITIRPKPDYNNNMVNFANFRYKTEELFANKNKFVHGEYVFEQKAITADNLGYGFHMHGIVGITMQTRKNEIVSHAQTVFKNIAAANCIQVDIISNMLQLDRYKSYIRDGKKLNDDKKAAHEQDKYWRRKYDIPELIEF